VQSPEKGIGASVHRKEDDRLLSGCGCYSDDINLPSQAYAVMVRSPHAHARIVSIDSSAARALPGVIAVMTGAEFVADGLKSIPHSPFPPSPPDIRLSNRDGSPIFVAPHWPLPSDKARFVGEAIAMVIAESIPIAKDACDLVQVEYEMLAAVTDTSAAAGAGAPLVWDETVSNICIDAEVGDRESTAAAFGKAKHVSRLDTHINRVTAVPMEPRAAVGDYDRIADRYTLYAGSGGVARQRRELAAILGVPQEGVRVVSRDVGGNFGTRNPFYPEFALVVWAAKSLGRPVKWTCERQEAFLTDYQGRDVVAQAELALDDEGYILGLRGTIIGNVGAHAVSFTPLTKTIETLPGLYRIPSAHIRAISVLSNTSPTVARAARNRCLS
jgi:carbon-monoxide dehydrogenase large subunit